MVFLITEIFFFLSLIGLTVLVFKKIPVLNELPVETNKNKNDHIINLKKKVVKMNPLKNFSSEIILQKVLSKIRVTNLKIENKTSKSLSNLRRNYKKKQNLRKGDNYWQQVRNATKEDKTDKEPKEKKPE
ncbi:MAG: hypothetical protein ACOC1P_01630 [Minisyncoccales bacterium]